MGTRNITQIILDGKTVVSQYCQWDGYLSGAGDDQLSFLAGLGYKRPQHGGDHHGEPSGDVIKFDRETFVANLRQVKEVTDKQRAAYWKAIGTKGEWVTLEQSNEFLKRHLTLHRDCTGAELMAMIQIGVAKEVQLDLNFVYEGLFCEWAYVLDLDKNVWEIYEGFNQKALKPTDRFYRKPTGKEEYFGPKLFASFPLNKLPKDLKKLIAKTEGK